MADQSRRVALATMIGSTVEWYDFFVYGTAAAVVLNKLFFPATEPAVGTMLAFATFATGWLARPVGGVLAGHFGDRVSRKTMLVITVVGMGLATMLIGALPTYASIGISAPIVLVILRVLQGLAVGGEYGGSVVMALEHAREGKRGVAASWPQVGAPAGLVLGTGVFYGFAEMPDAAFYSWGWRMPFLLSIVLVGVGLVIRLKIEESPTFERTRDADDVVRIPVVEVLAKHWRRVLLVVFAHIAPNTFFYTFATFILSYATKQRGYSVSTALLAVSLAALVEVVTLPLYARLSDRLGRRPVYVGGLAGLAVLTVPFFVLVDLRTGPALFLALAMGLGLAHSAVFGAQASFFSELFPTRVRYTGLSLGYQVAGALFGGPLPIIATALVATAGGAPWLFAGYLIVTAVFSAVAAIIAPETSRLRLDDAADPARAAEQPTTATP